MSGNYRPISLTSVVDKLLKNIIRDKIVSYLERYCLLKDSQLDSRYKTSYFSNMLIFYNDRFFCARYHQIVIHCIS